MYWTSRNAEINGGYVMSTKQLYIFPENLDKKKVNKTDNWLSREGYGDIYFIFNDKIQKWFRIENRKGCKGCKGWKLPHVEMEHIIKGREFWSVWLDWDDCITVEDALEKAYAET